MSSIRISEEEGVRYLQFGAHWIQGAMRINRPWALELEYTRDMMFPLLLRDSAWPRSVLQIGLGAGSTAKFFHRHRPKARLEVIEIDPEVVMTAWQFFRLPDESSRFRIEIGDGYRYMATTRRRFDLILLDGFDAKVRAGNLDSPAFYRNCRTRLTGQGMMVTNLVSRRGRPTASIDRIRKAFGNRMLALPPAEANTIVIAAVCAPVRVSCDRLRTSAKKLRAATGLSLLPAISRLGSEDLSL